MDIKALTFTLEDVQLRVAPWVKLEHLSQVLDGLSIRLKSGALEIDVPLFELPVVDLLTPRPVQVLKKDDLKGTDDETDLHSRSGSASDAQRF